MSTSGKIDEGDRDAGGNKNVHRLRSSAAQIIATLGFSILLAALGLILCMPTIVIGGLLNNDDEFSLDENSASWFGSIIFMTQPAGSLVSGFLQDKFGRKRCMIAVNIPQIAGWICLYYSENTLVLYTAATLMGLSIGFMEAPILSYIGEITEPRMRGTLSVLGSSFAGVGVLIECLLGAITDWRSVCAISTSLPILALISISLIPESPTWLICVGRIAEAEQSLCWLRGWVHPVCVREEFLSLLSYVGSPSVHEMTDISIRKENSKELNKEKERKLSPGVIDNLLFLNQPKIYKPMTLVFFYFCVSHTISLLGMRPFLVKIFADIGMPMRPHWVLVISGVLQVLGNALCMLTMPKFGKRMNTFLSLSVSVASCTLLGILLMMENKLPWLTFSLFSIIFFATGFGVGTIPWVLLSEIYPLEGRGIAGGLSAAFSYLIGFVVTKSYINLTHTFDVHGTCFVYSVVGFLGFIYLYFKLPETEGKTLQEIEDFFKKEKKSIVTEKEGVNHLAKLR